MIGDYDTSLKSTLDGKASSGHTHGNITNAGKLGTASMVVVTDSNKYVTTSSTITTTELGYLNGVTANIQSQLNDRPTNQALETYIYSEEIEGETIYGSSGSFSELQASTLTNQRGDYAVFSPTQNVNIEIVSNLPSSPSSNTIYFVI